MHNNPLISIIIPTKNAEKTLPTCLESCINQTWDLIEILLIDNASTDNTRNYIQELNSSKIKLISIKESGIYEAMNEGIGQANGEWFIFLGADDQFTSLTILSEIFEKHTIGEDIRLLLGSVVNENRSSTKIKKHYSNHLNRGIYWRNTLHHQGIFYHKSLFDKHLFQTKYKILADYALNLCLFHEKQKHMWLINKTISICNASGISKSFTKELYAEELALKKEHLPTWAYFLSIPLIRCKVLYKVRD
jgi:putative colanic acid biosynthesis glycosyltransferase